jgi:hypothetical protein
MEEDRKLYGLSKLIELIEQTNADNFLKKIINQNSEGSMNS